MHVKTKIIFPESIHAIVKWTTVKSKTEKDKYDNPITRRLEIPQWDKMEHLPKEAIDYFKKKKIIIEEQDHLPSNNQFFRRELDTMINLFLEEKGIAEQSLIDIKYNVAYQGEGYTQESAMIIYRSEI